MPIDFRSVFQVFSRRPGNRERTLSPVTMEFRRRFWMLIEHRLSDSGYIDDFIHTVREKLLFSTGRSRLASQQVHSEDRDLLVYLSNCSNSEFLDFMELALGEGMTFYLHISPYEERLIADINASLNADNIPYQLTPYVWEKLDDGGLTISHYPQVICREDEVVYTYAIEPALHVLAQKGLESANTEYLKALADYRKGDYGDSLVKCGSAFESTLKLICKRRKWQYKETDTASTLLDIFFSLTGLDRFFRDPLLLIGTIRNRLSTAHGAGAVRKNVPQHVARYAINATASAIIFLVDEAWQ